MYKVIMAAIAAVASISVNAQVHAPGPSSPDPVYLRSSIGVAAFELDQKAEDFDKDQSIGFSLVGGYQYNRHIAFEFGFYDIGESDSIVDFEYGDLQTYGRAGRVYGTRSFTGRALGASVRLHTDMQKPLYVGVLAGYQYWKISTLSDLIEEYTVDLSFYDDYYLGQPPISGSSGYKSTSTEKGNDPFYGAFAIWNSAIGELGLEYTRFDIDGDQPALLAGSYTFRF